ncbi:MAG: formylmethanofuran dehydrogenase subunit A, partial [Desulfosporosinus sp.]|nr:formylmethanofuran dehydrogenase subunit A [Desulfosporosinus sp.]
NSARIMFPEDHYEHFRARTPATRSGTGYTVPSTFLTGYLYAGLGYTTIFEAAVPPLKARQAHEELLDTPLLDKGFYTLMGNNYMMMKILSEPDLQGRKERLRALVSWLLRSSKGYAVKAVNPGGVESWKWGQGATGLDSPVPPFGVTPRQIMLELVEAVEGLRLPHPLHLHANHLGEPGNVETTLETMRTLEGHRVHYTHLQFHAYGSTERGGIKSAAPKIAEYLNQHQEFTCDVGQIVFGPATTMTADAPVQFNLHRLTGSKWGNSDIEMETGSGIVSLTYRPGNLVNAIQWSIGLELLLLVKNPWQIFLTTDHPNAGPFTAYPEIIRLLMDVDYRREWLGKLHPKAYRYTNLMDINREYTLEEIAIITRAGQARALGLHHKGHLGEGAQADVAVYRLQDDKQAMFSRPSFVLKDGELIVRNGEVLRDRPGRTLYVNPEGDIRLPSDLADNFSNYYTVALSNFPVEEEYVARSEVIPCI